MATSERKSVLNWCRKLGCGFALSVVASWAAASASGQSALRSPGGFGPAPALAAPPTYIVPAAPEVSTLYADGSQIFVESSECWRLMCNSSPASGSATDLQTWATRHYASQAAGPVTPARGEPLGPPVEDPQRAGAHINIVFNADASVPPDARAALQTVAAYLDAQFSNPITVTISISFQDMGGGGVIGATSSYAVSNVSYAISRAGLVSGMDSDDVIQNWLPPGSTVPVRYNGALDTVTNENRVDWCRANYRATVGSVGSPDASMSFNTQFPFDFDPTNGISGGTMSFVDVCIHETGHALGFISGADGFGSFSFTSLDLFRFQRSNGCCNYNPGTYAAFQTTPRLVSYNSPDDDVNSDIVIAEYPMSDGTPYQASHFREQNNPWIGLLDPAFGYGETHYPDYYSLADKRMFDAIGYNYPPCIVPHFSQQPAYQSGCVGDTVALSVAVDNLAAPGYQWRIGNTNLLDDGVHLVGANAATLTLAGLTLADLSDRYNCVVTNTADDCVAASSFATVYVNDVATFTAQPAGQTLSEFQTAVFSVTASGADPLSYQWRHNGANVTDDGNFEGAATHTLILWAAAAPQAGYYDCVVTSACGPVASAAAHLILNTGYGAGRGDLNCDGTVGFRDINPFVLALSGGESTYGSAYPGCYWYNGDINADGNVNFKDINPFVALLSGQ